MNRRAPTLHLCSCGHFRVYHFEWAVAPESRTRTDDACTQCSVCYGFARDESRETADDVERTLLGRPFYRRGYGGVRTGAGILVVSGIAREPVAV